MAKKFYAVAFGKEGSGIYTRWDQTEPNVNGVSGVHYKAFPSEDAAREYVRGYGVADEAIKNFDAQPARAPLPGPLKPQSLIHRKPAQSDSVLPGAEMSASQTGAQAPDTVYAYVDGSFRQGYEVYGYGVVIVADGVVLKTFSGVGSRPEYVTMRNVAGEILGAVQAMKYALAAGVGHLVLYFDYQGIESWAQGTWKRNNDLTRGYHEFVRSLRPRLRITFQKVKGHSGDEFNDLADELAKQAVMDSRA